MQTNATNQTNNGFSCYGSSAVGYRYVAVLWGCVVTIVGTVGNLMTVLAFAIDARLRTRFNALVVNLAVADLLYCVLLQPVSVDSYLHLRWRGGELWCRAFGLVLFLSNAVSILTLCLVAVSRYLLIAKKNIFDRMLSVRGLPFLLASTWALALASFGPLWPVYVFVLQVCTCSFHRTDGRPYTTILLFFYFFIGLGCVGTFYLLIYKRVRLASKALLGYRFSRRSSRKRPDDSIPDSGAADTCSSYVSSQQKPGEDERKDSPKETSTPDSDPPPAAPPSKDAHPSSGENSEFKHVTRMCFAVFLCFVFCFVPFILLNIADREGSAAQVLHMFCANLTWLNSCINPVLYAAMNRQFRQGYRSLLIAPASLFRRRLT